MAKRSNSKTFSPCSVRYFLFLFFSFSSIPFLYWICFTAPCNLHDSINYSSELLDPSLWTGHLPSFPSTMNHLYFSQNPPQKLLNIALFVKKWPSASQAGGLERHALTLHLALARRGHATHIFTVQPDSPPEKSPHPNIHFHFSEPSPSGVLNQALAWEQFLAMNSTHKPFDVIHTESVALHHSRARNLSNLAVSWHGIAYETAHTDIVLDLLRSPGEARSMEQQQRLQGRAFRIIDEVKFFQNYANHVATSDHVGDVLKRIYMLPEERVHIILNGVNEDVFKQDSRRGMEFREKYGVPKSAALVLGMSGRLVKDKGHPIMFEALKQIFMENEEIQKRVYVLVAGNGPWGDRYRELGPNMLVLGPLEQVQIAQFYNALDVFVNPTLRAQGFDHTILEAMLSGKPVIATRFASITGSAIVSSKMGYTFSPTVESLKEGLYKVLKDGRRVLERKGEAARHRASKLFTATKMAAAYERLFLCISAQKREDSEYCQYPHPSDL